MLLENCLKKKAKDMTNMLAYHYCRCILWVLQCTWYRCSLTNYRIPPMSMHLELMDFAEDFARGNAENPYIFEINPCPVGSVSSFRHSNIIHLRIIIQLVL